MRTYTDTRDDITVAAWPWGPWHDDEARRTLARLPLRPADLLDWRLRNVIALGMVADELAGLS